MEIYLDNNATTKLIPEVIEAMIVELKQEPSNPSSIHSYGREAKKRLIFAKEQIAAMLKISPDELIFTSSATESINLALRGYFDDRKGHILSSDIEHACIESTLKYLETKGCKVTFLKAASKGYIDPQDIEAFLEKEKVDLVTLGAVNNETGIKNDIHKIADICSAYDIPFVVDGVALLGKEAFVISKGISAMAFSAHKLHGPKGVGFLYKKKSFKINPLITGGGQEKGLRSGTENLLGIVGLAKALEIFYQNPSQASLHIKTLRDRLQSHIEATCSPIFIPGTGDRIPNTLCVVFEGVEGETLLSLLDMHHIKASHGSACSSGSLEPSRILLNMGLPKDLARSAIRFSLSRLNTEEEIDKACSVIAEIVKRLRNP